MLMLDGLYLPGPANLVRDCQSVGAEAFATYCWRRASDDSWLPTYVAPDHLAACRQAGILLMAIVVPGNRPVAADIGASLVAAEQLGWMPQRDLIAIDLETYSEPPKDWTRAWVSAAKARGWSVGRYGQASVLANYDLADWSWIARWRTQAGGDIFPVPDTPPGGAWQYSHADTVPNGGTDYDASVIDPALWPVPSGPARGGKGVEPMASGASITIDGRTIVAVVRKTGGIALMSSDGGLGGLSKASWLPVDGPFGSTDVRDVWLGSDQANGASRVIVFCADGEGSVYGNAFSLDGQWTPSGWLSLEEFATIARVPVYEGQAPAAGPAVVPPHTHEVTVSGTSSGPTA